MLQSTVNLNGDGELEMGVQGVVLGLGMLFAATNLQSNALGQTACTGMEKKFVWSRGNGNDFHYRVIRVAWDLLPIQYTQYRVMRCNTWNDKKQNGRKPTETNQIQYTEPIETQLKQHIFGKATLRKSRNDAQILCIRYICMRYTLSPVTLQPELSVTNHS